MPRTLKDAAIEWFLQNAITKFLRDVKRNKGFMRMLDGYKTYIVAGVLLVVGGLQVVGIPIPGFGEDAGYAFTTAIGLITGRLGARNDAKKAVSDKGL